MGMVNLITDKPSPITIALMQKQKAAALAQTKSHAKDDGSSVFTLMDQNVTKGQIKNLITDKPTPITVALGQKKPVVQSLLAMEKKGIPVFVNPVIMKNTEAETDLGLKMLVGPDEVSVAKKNAAKMNAKKVATFAEIESSDEESEEELLLNTQNPVNNPPWNNWSVNQPTVPHNHGLSAKADMGQNIIVEGTPIAY